jgi:hypothetical protein
MSIETARSFFLWCAIFNYVFLLIWVAAATLGRGWLFKLTERFFRVTAGQIDLLNLVGITLYKSGIFFFNIIPFIALCMLK